ncbi:hypothetical protein I4U23_001024 [Adineta vaga]|nr:hypothetical protein I4U23_001024 [Adineta vaga]
MMNSTEQENSSVKILFDQNLKLVEQIVLGSMFISALISNIIVLYFMLNKKHRQITRMAFFILHLTIADLLVAFFSVLPMFIWKLTITFFGGDFLCRIVSFLMLTVSYISVYTLIVMAYDRYQAIVHPLSSYTWSNRSGLIQMVGVWCLSLFLASPQLFIFRLAYHPAYAKKTCMASFFASNRTWELIYIAWTIFMQFLLPMCILIFCYCSIYAIVNRNILMYPSKEYSKKRNSTNLLSNEVVQRSSTIPISSRKEIVNNSMRIHYSGRCSEITFLNKPSTDAVEKIMYSVVFRLPPASYPLTVNPTGNNLKEQKSQQRHGANHFLSRARLKTIKLTFIVVLTYILCSAPFYIGLIIMTLHGKFMSQKTMNWLMTIFSLLFNLNSCSNPIICLTLSKSLLRDQNSYVQRPLSSSKYPINDYNKRKTSKIFISV